MEIHTMEDFTIKQKYIQNKSNEILDLKITKKLKQI